MSTSTVTINVQRPTVGEVTHFGTFTCLTLHAEGTTIALFLNPESVRYFASAIMQADDNKRIVTTEDEDKPQELRPKRDAY